MASLFGYLYDGVPIFRHDQQMLRKKGLVSNEDKLNLAPTSSTSSVSEYATPQAGRRGEQDAEGGNPRSPSTERQQTAQVRGAGDAAQSGSEHDGRPSSCTKKRKALDSDLRPAGSEAEEDSGSPVHTALKKTRTASEFSADPTNPGRDRVNDRQSIPPDPDVSDTSSPTSDEIPTSRLGSSPANARLAFRQEVYNAVLGIGGSTWSDIGLISTRRHRDGEEEL